MYGLKTVTTCSIIQSCYLSTVDYGDWFDYVLQMEEEMRKGEYNIHLVYYEDLKEVIMMYLGIANAIVTFNAIVGFIRSYLTWRKA